MEIRPLVDFLAPFLAPLLEGAGRATAAAAGEAWDHAVRLWGRLADRVRSRPAALEAVQDVAEAPDSTGARDALAWQLEKLLNADAELREELSALWSQATAAGVTVTNVTASGTRSIAVGRDVSGGSVSTGDTASPRRDPDE
ncbi:hypothetical protein [Streptomyces sp. NPDC052012]|uniref:hypothetical protein n=1 Tax=Streptomyces sp. NPDC052012 TaxID=3155051 RepID=UPI00344C1CE0